MSSIPTKEIRFAVVMYGGISLTVYINGAAQELYALAEATARQTPGKPEMADAETLTGTAAVYRELATLVNDDGTPVRFVVDILSGTSAGGINAVYLAKALANNQSIAELKRLWIEKADFSLLLNDEPTVSELGLPVEDPPDALLNHPRMYHELLSAFEGMETEKPGSSRFVEELDLYITATDLRGLRQPVVLSDGMVCEKKHRTVFRFKYLNDTVGADDNDFITSNNALLAFMTRATSSVPVAFPPIRLNDIQPVLQATRNRAEELPRWKRFFRSASAEKGLQQCGDSLDFAERAYADGGLLDNKPFSYATETLLRRRADVPVDRKLLYIEPDPEKIGQTPELKAVPDALETALAGLLEIPRYETIREDIARVRERNRLIYRLQRILDGMEQDAENATRLARAEKRDPSETEVLRTPEGTEDWRKKGLAILAAERGAAYAAYTRLKIASITDDLADLMTRIAGFDPESDTLLAIRSLTRAWRETAYREDDPDDGRPLYTEFLLNYDFTYRLRRLNFLQRKIDEVYRLDAVSEKILERAGHSLAEITASETTQAAFRAALRDLKAELSKVLLFLRREARTLRATDGSSPITAAIAALDLHAPDIAWILGSEDDPQGASNPAARHIEEQCFLRARELMHERGLQEKLQTVAQAVAARTSPALQEASAWCRAIFRDPAEETPEKRIALHLLRRYFFFYEEFDSVRFPMLYGTDAGETAYVDVLRLSPSDESTLLSESQTRRLAGLSLGHFGGFFYAQWRRNDVLWGRLDAAERLIRTLLPLDKKADADRLVNQAFACILEEELGELDEEARNIALLEPILRTPDGKPNPDLLVSYYQKITNLPLSEWFRERLPSEYTLQRLYKERYQALCHPDRSKVHQDMRRALFISAALIGGLARNRGGFLAFMLRGLSWLVRFIGLLFGLRAAL